MATVATEKAADTAGYMATTNADAPDSNGEAATTADVVGDVPDFDHAGDFSEDNVVGAVVDGAHQETDEMNDPGVEPEIVFRGLYFVRIPRPPVDDSNVKKLRDEFQNQLTKVKALNSKLQLKRGEVNELRRQLGVARSLRDGSSPEYDAKIERMNSLKALKSGLIKQIQEIRTGIKGIDVKTEEELEEKIRDMEHQIQHEPLTLRTEKQFVSQIAKLNSQRDKVRTYESQKTNYSELENELSKVKAVIDELEGEFQILKGERDQAKEIIDELKKKMDVAKQALTELEVEQNDCVRRMNDAREMLDKAKVDLDSQMSDYSQNRKFSGTIRDLVSEGRVDDARAECLQQVEFYLQKLNTDASFRAEYCRLWSQQRKYVVSELLPSSSVAGAEPTKQAKQATQPAKPPPKPQGAAKAKAIIDAVLENASKEMQRNRAAEPAVADDDESDEDTYVHLPIQSTRLEAKIEKPAAKATGINYNKYLLDLPTKAYDADFVPPVSEKGPELSQEELKEKVRLENKVKAQEAEARKKKRAEAAVRKRQKAAEQQQKEQQQRGQLKPSETRKKVETETEPELETEEELVSETLAPTSSVVPRAAPQPTKQVAPPRPPAPRVKRPRAKDSPIKKFWKDYQIWIVVGVVVLILAIILLLML